jgi:hypothetical protein
MSTRKEILEMLAAGEIDVTRATDMLSSLRDPSAEPAIPVPPEPPAPPRAPEPPALPVDTYGRRWLRIHVSDLKSGRSRVKVNVPLGLVQFGLKIGSRFTDEVDSDMIADVMHVLESGDISGTLVEVEDMEDNERVHIFVD